MSKKGKISLFVFIFLLALIVLIHVQSRRVILALVETQAADSVETTIGTLQLLPFKQSIRLKDVSVSIRNKDSAGFRKASVKRVYLELGSLWDFFFGGTLVIGKMACEGGELIMARKPDIGFDTTTHVPFDLSTITEGLKNNAIRFRIQDMSFQDFNLTLLNDSAITPTMIKHFEFRARDLYLSTDSILKRKPYIEFGLPAQQINLRNGPTTIKFDTLFFSTTDNSIQINELEVLMSDQESGSDYKINSDKVRVAYFDFESLYTKGIAIVDTVFLGKSKLLAKVRVENQVNPIRKNEATSQLLPYVLVRHLVFRQLAADVHLQRGDIGNSFAINNSFVTIQNLEHNPDSSQRLSAMDFEILLSDYETFLNNKNTTITFDTIRLHKKGLSLLNFELSKTKQQAPVLQAPVFELREVDWYTLLFFKKLVAEEAVVLNPVVNTTFLPPKGDGATSQDLTVLKSIKEFLDVDLFSLKNATANLNFDQGRTSVSMKGIDASIRTNRMIQSKSLDELLEATPVFTFRNFILKSNSRRGNIENFSLRQGSFHFGNIVYSDGNKIDLKFNNLNIGGVSYDQALKKIALSGLGWQSATISIDGSSFEGKSTERNLPAISLSMVRGGNTEVKYATRDLMVNAHFHKINAGALQLSDIITMEEIDLAGSNATGQRDSTRLSVSKFVFADDESVLEDILWDQYGVDTLRTSIDRISFMADFNLLAQQQVSVPRLEVVALKADYSKRDSTHRILAKARTNLVVKEVRYDRKKLTIGSIDQAIDSIYYLNEKRIARKVEVPTDAPINERWKVRDKVDSLFDTENSVGVLMRKNVGGAPSSRETSAESPFSTLSTMVESVQNGIAISVSDIEIFSPDSSLQVTARVDSVRFNDLRLQHNDIHAVIKHGAVKGLLLNSQRLRQPMEMFRANYPTVSVHDLKLSIETSRNLFQVDRFDYDPLLSEGSISRLELRPLKDKQAFLDESFFQTNFMHTKIKSLSFHDLDTERFAADSTIHMRTIRIVAPSLEIGRDKTHPFYSSKIKLLPTNTFQKLGVKFKVDSLQFRDGRIGYTEKSKVTGKEGLIHFTNVQGLVRNIKNIELEGDDTLYIRASARFLDSANVNLRVRESYKDTLAGFLMTTQVSPFHTSILNPVLVPLVSVEFQSGFVDTLQMVAIGREHISLGRMKFLYRDLKVNFLDQNDTSRHSIKNYILKFAANNLVIKTNNKKRIGDVFELRDRNRAVFQYWVKMILSGVTTSVGAKSNRSQMKKYSRELNTRKLPPIEVPLSGF